MNITETEQNVIFALGDRFDARHVSEAKEAISPILRRGDIRSLVDMSGTKVIDSSGLGFLVGIFKTLRVGEGDMALMRPSEGVRKLLEITRLDQVFRIVDGLENAWSA